MSNDNVQTQAFDQLALQVVAVPLKGEQGEQGGRGVKGDTGADNYQLWLANGHTGTYEDYLASLKGEDGQDGKVVNRGPWAPGVYNPGDFVTWLNNEGDSEMYFVYGGEPFVSSDPPDVDTGNWTLVSIVHPEPEMDSVTVLAGIGNTSIDCALGRFFTMTLTGNVTGILFANLPPAGKAISLMVRITQAATPFTMAWPASFKWPGGVAGVISTTANAVDILTITSFDQGVTWNAELSKAYA